MRELWMKFIFSQNVIIMRSKSTLPILLNEAKVGSTDTCGAVTYLLLYF